MMQNRYLSDETSETLAAMHNLAVLYRAAGICDKAEVLVRETLDLHTQVLGVDHPDTLIAMNNRARTLVCVLFNIHLSKVVHG